MAKGKARTKLLDHSASLVEGSVSGPTWDFIYGASSVRHPDYQVGDRAVLPDGRVFRYALAVAAVKTGLGAKAWDEELIKYANLAAGSAIGASSVQVTIANTDGVAGDGAIAEDELRGGYVCIYDVGDVVRRHRGVVGNSVMTAAAIAAGNAIMTIYLDGSLDIAMTTAAHDIEVLGNPYRNTRWVNDTHSSIMGVPMRAAAAGQYYWMQTWGPICLSPGDAGSGGGTEERQVTFGGNGAIFAHDAAHATTLQEQHAGFIIQKDSAGGDGPPFVMLQISP